MSKSKSKGRKATKATVRQADLSNFMVATAVVAGREIKFKWTDAFRAGDEAEEAKSELAGARLAVDAMILGLAKKATSVEHWSDVYRTMYGLIRAEKRDVAQPVYNAVSLCNRAFRAGLIQQATSVETLKKQLKDLATQERAGAAGDALGMVTTLTNLRKLAQELSEPQRMSLAGTLAEVLTQYTKLLPTVAPDHEELVPTTIAPAASLAGAKPRAAQNAAAPRAGV